MGLIAKAKGGGNFELIPEDQHLARCVMVADIGTHEHVYEGEVKHKHQCVIGWELPEVLQVYDPDKGEEPAMLSSFYSVSLNEKAKLRHMLESWRGRAFTPEELEGFDLFCLCGIGCLVQVVHAHKVKKNNEVWAKVQNVSKVHKSMIVPAQVNRSLTFSMDTATSDDFEALPEWLKKHVRKSAEWPVFCKRTGAVDSQVGEAAEYQEDLSGGAAQPDVPF